jgi:sarcosine oxidase subunit alpha
VIIAAAVAAAGVEVLTDAVVTGRYDGNWVAVVQRGLLHVTERPPGAPASP